MRRRGFRCHLRWPLASALAAFLLAATAVAEPVAIEAIRDAGVERLRMTFARPVDFTASAIDGLLTLTFSRPLDADLRPAASLARLAGPARLSDDRRSLLLPLQPGASALSYADDRIVFVDLLAAGPAAAESDASKKPQPPSPAERETVRIRFGEHPGFSRIVFDWPQEVGYRLERTADGAIIRFDRSARLDAGKAGRRPSRIRAVEVLPTDGEGQVRIALAAADAVLRDFRLGPKVVIDVMAPAAPAASSSAPPEMAEGGGEGGGFVPRPPLPRPLLAEPQPPPDAPAPTVPQPSETAAALPPSLLPTLATVREATAEPPMPQLRFDWPEPVAAAVFRRGERLWIVFDAPSQPDLDALRAGAGSAIGSVRQLPADNATVLIVEPLVTTPPRLARAGHAWILGFGNTPPASAPEPLIPMPEPHAVGGPRLMVAVPAPGQPITLGDPEVGDTLIVVPTVPLGRGVNRHYRYPMFELLPTTQGVVVAPLIDSLVVAAQPQGITVSSLAGLSLSPLPEPVRAGTRLAPPAGVKPTLNLQRWADLPPTEFIARRQALTREVALASGGERAQARLALGEFYLAHGLAAEAHGEAKVIADGDEQAAALASVRLLTGAAQLLQGRLESAQSTLRDASLDGLDEAALWRTATDAALARVATTAIPFDRHGALLLGYPRPLRLFLTPLLLEAALASGQLQAARHLLDTARADAPAAAEAACLDVSEGRLRLAGGDREGARQAFLRARAGPSPRAQLMAEMELVEQELKEGALSVLAASERLERLRYTWRGDALEARLLLRLSELSAQAGEFAHALRTLRQVASYFRGRPEAAVATERMMALFQSLYLDGAAEPLSPLAAVGLYLEFRELTPPGEKGRRLLLGLAERLIALELPAAAAGLLEPALAATPDRAARVELGTALARAEDQAGRPEAVLAALARSHADQMAPADVLTRRRLQAKALIDLDRHDEALAVLAQLGSGEAAQLRAEVHRRKGDWMAASRALADRLSAPAETLAGEGKAAARGAAQDAAFPIADDQPLGPNADRTAIKRAVEDAVRLRDALKAGSPAANSAGER